MIELAENYMVAQKPEDSRKEDAEGQRRIRKPVLEYKNCKKLEESQIKGRPETPIVATPAGKRARCPKA